MLFHSAIFLQFFSGFLLLFYLCRNSLRARNALIVAASYVFYGWWDYRFLGLLAFSSLVDFYIGLVLGRTTDDRRRRWLLGASLAANLGLLGFFKYYGFFVESLARLLEVWGAPFHPRTLDIILPVGISFYTFQTLSYTIDIYRRKMEPTRNLVDFLAYVSFFPQLVAGPIERAGHLLPQFERPLRITREMLEEGIWLVLWGLFKKVVLADNFGPLADLVYGLPNPSGPLVFLGTVAFAFQIYCDFSGYSDMARGLGKLLGFDLMFNFRIPYAAKDLRDFWSRWHISLSTWLRDYLYIPLGGNRGGKGRTVVNLMLTMLLGGLWHGAAGTFLLWGLWHGAGLAAGRAAEWRRGKRRLMPEVCGWAGTMLFVLYGWLLFRAESMHQIVVFTQALGNGSLPDWFWAYLLNICVFATPLVGMEAYLEKRGDLLAPLGWRVWLRYGIQGLMVAGILFFWEKELSPFIYFQF